MTRSDLKKQKRKYIKKLILSNIRDIIIILGLAVLVKAYIIEIGSISGHSMEPNLKDKQMILIKKWDTHLGGKGNGVDFYDKVIVDNVELKGEKEPINIAKRVIGLPGDHIEIINGDIYRNNKKINEPLIKEKAKQIDQSFEIGEKEIFVMGDNRNNSTDSRHFGPLPIEKVSGEIVANFDVKWLTSLEKKVRSIFNSSKTN